MGCEFVIRGANNRAYCVLNQNLPAIPPGLTTSFNPKVSLPANPGQSVTFTVSIIGTTLKKSTTYTVPNPTYQLKIENLASDWNGKDELKIGDCRFWIED